jgi:hypothetical protein
MPRMNGGEPKIEIFKPFGEAFELMKKILFQPFDLKKWLIIRFSAWARSRWCSCDNLVPITMCGRASYRRDFCLC